MLKEEAIKKECIKNGHEGFQIVAVDLSDELIKISNQEKYYCVKCLLEKIGNKKIILFEEAIKKVEIANQELKKLQADKQIKTRESIQKLSDVIKSIEGSFKKQFDDLKNQLEIQIDQEQQYQISEPKTSNDQSKPLSTCYQEDGKLASPSPNIDYKEITESLIQIRKLLKYLENFEQFQDVDKEIQKIEQTCQINLEIDENYKVNKYIQYLENPALNFTCDTHKKDIIMFNLNKDQFEQTNPFLCVECVYDLLSGGNKAVSNTISLMKAEQKWNEYIEEQMEKRSQRQSRLNQAIAFIKKLQEKQNSELNIMIQSLNEQLKKQPKEYEELMKLKKTCLQHQDKQNLHEIIKMLFLTNDNQKIEQISIYEDQEFFQIQKRVLDELIKENRLVQDQIQGLQNYEQ